LILDAVCEGHGHTTISEIHARVQARAPAINLATVYRNLDFFCDLGLVVSADLGDGHKIYEIARSEPHHHLVCQRCGRVRDVSHEVVAGLFAGIESASQFYVEMDHLVLFGQCCACQDAGKDA
jgi:Fur family ferric uptake transcriptional regulator